MNCNRFHPDAANDLQGLLPCELGEDHVTDHEATDMNGRVVQWKRESCGHFVGGKRCSRMPGHPDEHRP